MTAAKPLGQGVAFPPRVNADGAIAWSAGPININESIYHILFTNRGERVWRPDFGAGLRSFIYGPNTAATRHLIQEQIVTALARWEKRITVKAVTVQPDPADQQAVTATISYAIRGTGSEDKLSLRVPIAAGGV